MNPRFSIESIARPIPAPAGIGRRSFRAILVMLASVLLGIQSAPAGEGDEVVTGVGVEAEAAAAGAATRSPPDGGGGRGVPRSR